MSLQTFRLLVLSDSTVSGLVSDRMTQNMMPPEATTPAITFFKVSEKPDIDTCGDLYVNTRIQTNVYSTLATTVATIHAAMVAKLHKYSGTYNSQIIVNCFMDFGMTTYEPETGLYRQIADWKFYTKGV